jgi:LEA14-like dessication related protein
MIGRKLPLILGGLILLGGLAFGIIQYKKLMDYEITPLDPRTISKNGRNYKILVPLMFKNKSSLGYKLENQRYKIFIGNLEIAKGSSKESFNILPKKETRIEFVVDFTLPQLSRSISLVTEFLANPFIDIEVEWDVKFLGFNVPVKQRIKTKV